MTEQMATIAAQDIVAKINGGQSYTFELAARSVLELGNRGVFLGVDPVRPPRDKVPAVSQGRQWLWTKRAFERSYLWSAKHGRRMPTTFGW